MAVNGSVRIDVGQNLGFCACLLEVTMAAVNRDELTMLDDFEEVMVEFLVHERVPNLRRIIEDNDKRKHFSIGAEYMPLKDSYSMQVNTSGKLFRQLSGLFSTTFGGLMPCAHHCFSFLYQMSRLMGNPKKYFELGDEAVRKAQEELAARERLLNNGIGSIKKNVHLRISGEIGLDREFFTGMFLLLLQLSVRRLVVN